MTGATEDPSDVVVYKLNKVTATSDGVLGAAREEQPGVACGGICT
eukprot:gene8586-8768_t